MSNGALVIESESNGQLKCRYLHPYGPFRILFFNSEQDALNFADDNKLEVRDNRETEDNDSK